MSVRWRLGATPPDSLSLRRLGTSSLDPGWSPSFAKPWVRQCACPFSTKNYPKISVFLVINLKIRGAWGQSPQTPLAFGSWMLRPLNPPVVPLSLCRILDAPLDTPMKFCPPEILGWLRHCMYSLRLYLNCIKCCRFAVRCGLCDWADVHIKIGNVSS